MNLSRWVVEAKEPTGYDGDRVTFVVDVSEVLMCINVICESLVPDLSKSQLPFLKLSNECSLLWAIRR